VVEQNHLLHQQTQNRLGSQQVIQGHFGVRGRRQQELRRIRQVEQKLFEPQLERLMRDDEEVFGGAHAGSMLVRRDGVLRAQDLLQVEIPGIRKSRRRLHGRL
jgi:hypothetical protein